MSKPRIGQRYLERLALTLEYLSSSFSSLPWWDLWTALEQFVGPAVDREHLSVDTFTEPKM